MFSMLRHSFAVDVNKAWWWLGLQKFSEFRYYSNKMPFLFHYQLSTECKNATTFQGFFPTNSNQHTTHCTLLSSEWPSVWAVVVEVECSIIITTTMENTLDLYTIAWLVQRNLVRSWWIRRQELENRRSGVSKEGTMASLCNAGPPQAQFTNVAFPIKVLRLLLHEQSPGCEAMSLLALHLTSSLVMIL